MSKIILEVKDEDLLRFGEAKMREEIEHTLKWLKIKGLLKSISSAVGKLKVDYKKEVQMIKKEAWKEYKKDLPL
jgi:hypothetical protein